VIIQLAANLGEGKESKLGEGETQQAGCKPSFRWLLTVGPENTTISQPPEELEKIC
jgi:hypothetical protein